jgi:glucose/arabinose dehydrogenase
MLSTAGRDWGRSARTFFCVAELRRTNVEAVEVDFWYKRAVSHEVMIMRCLLQRSLAALTSLALSLVAVTLSAQQSAQQIVGPPLVPLPDAPVILDTSRRSPAGVKIPGPQVRIVPTKGLVRPYAIAFLPDGAMLITERPGRLRIVRNGVLDPQPISGIPQVLDRQFKGLNDVALHPRFAENRWVYFTYYQPRAEAQDGGTAVLARGRLDGHALTDVRDLFVANGMVGGASAARFVFGRDGKIYLAIGIPTPNLRKGYVTAADAQRPDSHYGKVLRLNDDGSAPADNPFAGVPKYKPEIFALGIRNAMGIIVHPETGEIWANENGPQGGDEINVIKRGLNYGWPVISYGRAYSGELGGTSGPSTGRPSGDDLEQPWLFWAPSIGISGMTFYTGDRFPEWKGSILVGGLVGEQLQRIILGPNGLPIRRDILLTELKQRIREVRQGPDGLVYLLTDEADGALLRLEPASATR